VRGSLTSMVEDALERPLALMCNPPGSLDTFAYGDVVPLGFLLMALGPDFSEHQRLKNLLRGKRQGLL
jgi:hypothetical protein